MKYFIVIVFFIIFVGGDQVYGCSYMRPQEFMFSQIGTWKQNKIQQSEASMGQKVIWEKIPAPEVKIIKLIRGTSNQETHCDDIGKIYIEISLPKNSTYEIKEFGVRFKVKKDELLNSFFPNYPVVPEIKDGKAIVFFVWFDKFPKYQVPLDLEVEVFLISHTALEGKATTFKVEPEFGS